MTLEKFLTVFKSIVNEFKILNEHFDIDSKSTTADYDQVFSRWVSDMSRRYNGIPINMHWGTSSRAINKNQMLFNIIYKDDYFSELKYNFQKTFIIGFPYALKEKIQLLEQIIKDFEKFNNQYDKNEYGEVSDFDRAFTGWKETALDRSPGLAVDIHWGNKEKDLIDNFFFLNIMFKDDFLFKIKYY